MTTFRERRATTSKGWKMEDERYELLLLYKFIGGKCWQEKSSDGLDKRVMKHIKKALLFFFNVVLH
jgi:hypothetical protein